MEGRVTLALALALALLLLVLQTLASLQASHQHRLCPPVARSRLRITKSP